MARMARAHCRASLFPRHCVTPERSPPSVTASQLFQPPAILSRLGGRRSRAQRGDPSQPLGLCLHPLCSPGGAQPRAARRSLATPCHPLPSRGAPEPRAARRPLATPWALPTPFMLPRGRLAALASRPAAFPGSPAVPPAVPLLSPCRFPCRFPGCFPCFSPSTPSVAPCRSLLHLVALVAPKNKTPLHFSFCETLSFSGATNLFSCYKLPPQKNNILS
jgi:hypothetical protein